MNIFISWSGETSRLIAEELKKFFPKIIQSARPYYTPDDIEKGSRWEEDIHKKLADSYIGIICLTKNNTEKPWIHFEAGALSTKLGKSKVCSIAFGIKKSQIQKPLASFQLTEFEKNDFLKLMKSINSSLEKDAISEELLLTLFNAFYGELEQKINEILLSEKDTTQKPERSEKDILEEILDLVRKQNNQTPSMLVGEKIQQTFARKKIAQENYGSANGELLFGSRVYHQRHGSGTLQGILTTKDGTKLARVLFDEHSDAPLMVSLNRLVQQE